PGQDRERPERGDEAADGDRVAAARPHVHRRPLRPELRPHPRAEMALGLLVVVGPDRRHDDRPAHLLPFQALALSARKPPLARRIGVPLAVGGAVASIVSMATPWARVDLYHDGSPTVAVRGKQIGHDLGGTPWAWFLAGFAVIALVALARRRNEVATL